MKAPFQKRWILFSRLLGIYIATNSLVLNADSGDSLFVNWRTHTNGISGDWFGLAQPMKTYGLSVNGEFKQLYLCEVSGGLPNQQKSSWDNEVKMRFFYDFEPLFGIQGLTSESNWRNRTGGNPQYEAGTLNLFNPTVLSGNTGLRILTQQV